MATPDLVPTTRRFGDHVFWKLYAAAYTLLVVGGMAIAARDHTIFTPYRLLNHASSLVLIAGAFNLAVHRRVGSPLFWKCALAYAGSMLAVDLAIAFQAPTAHPATPLVHFLGFVVAMLVTVAVNGPALVALYRSGFRSRGRTPA